MQCNPQKFREKLLAHIEAHVAPTSCVHTSFSFTDIHILHVNFYRSASVYTFTGFISIPETREKKKKKTNQRIRNAVRYYGCVRNIA